jgi:hypothetical protein
MRDYVRELREVLGPKPLILVGACVIVIDA